MSIMCKLKISRDPFLSLVVTTRNDDHGGNQLQRMQLFIDCFTGQCTKHKIPSELIIVEWNPPPGRPGLIDVLNWPAGPGHCQIRIIEVPEKIHARLKYSDRLPLFQMIAKNVGIRRARGKFVLATNIDILFTDAMMKAMGGDCLKNGRLYRADRFDVPADVPRDKSIIDQLNYCAKNVIRVNTRKGTFTPLPKLSYRVKFLVNLALDRLSLLIKIILHGIYLSLLWIPLLPYRAVKLLEFVLARPGEFAYKVKEYCGRLVYIAREYFARLVSGVCLILRKSFLKKTHTATEARLHTNACGDFTLMAREQWFALRGYPELEIFSIHLDSLLCYMAFHAGIRESFINYPIYHIEHSSGWSPDEINRLVERMESKGIPMVTMDQLNNWDVEMSLAHAPILFNGQDWGLVAEDLHETDINKPDKIAP
jgi:hypothetical protein